MTAFRRGKAWHAKYVRHRRQVWVPGGPWQTKRQALDAEAAHRAEPGHGDVTCAAWADRWVREFPRPTAATRRQYEWAARMFAAHFADRPLACVSRLDARTWALTRPRKVAPILGTMYEDARNMGVLEHNPFRSLRLPSPERKRALNVPTISDLDRLAAACTTLGAYGDEFAATIRFAAWTAVRQGELFALRWSDVHGDELTVQRAQRQDGTCGAPKNGLDRTVVLLQPALDALEVAERSRRPDCLIWHAVRGGRLTKSVHAWPWQKVRASAGMEDTRWHDLRHFGASRLLDLGLSPYDVSLHLGHTDGGALVVERYGHPDHRIVRRRIRAAFDLGVGELLPAEDSDPDQKISRRGVA
jgi:integrase